MKYKPQKPISIWVMLSYLPILVSSEQFKDTKIKSKDEVLISEIFVEKINYVENALDYINKYNQHLDAESTNYVNELDELIILLDKVIHELSVEGDLYKSIDTKLKKAHESFLYAESKVEDPDLPPDIRAEYSKISHRIDLQITKINNIITIFKESHLNLKSRRRLLIEEKEFITFMIQTRELERIREIVIPVMTNEVK